MSHSYSEHIDNYPCFQIAPPRPSKKTKTKNLSPHKRDCHSTHIDNTLLSFYLRPSCIRHHTLYFLLSSRAESMVSHLQLALYLWPLVFIPMLKLFTLLISFHKGLMAFSTSWRKADGWWRRRQRSENKKRRKDQEEEQMVGRVRRRTNDGMYMTGERAMKKYSLKYWQLLRCLW